MKTWLEHKLLGQIRNYDEREPKLYLVLADLVSRTNNHKQERRARLINNITTIAVRNAIHRDTNIIKHWAAHDYTTSLIVGSAPLPTDMFS